MEETGAIRRNFNAPAASIRRHQPLRRSFAYEAAVRSTNNSSMNEGSRQGNNNATLRFPVHLARPANQSFHRRNYYRPPYEVPPRNQNNHLCHYEVPPAAQQGNDVRRNEIPPHLQNVPRHHQNFPAQPFTMRTRITNFVVNLQDGVDIELTLQDYQAMRAHEISRAHAISRAREILYDRMQQMLLERMLEEEAREMRSGWSEEDIMKCLKTRSNGASLGNDQENTICTIYQDEYQIEDTIGTLDCQHEFHRDCIKDRLLGNSICPICRRPALDSDSSTN